MMFVFSTTASLTAQSSLTFSVSPLYSMPLGSSADIYQYGIGGTIEVQTPFLIQSLGGFGSLGYENVALQAGAGNLSIITFGAGAQYTPFRFGVFSTSIFVGMGGYLGVYQQNPLLFNPYLQTGLSIDAALSDGFQLSLKPVYKNLISAGFNSSQLAAILKEYQKIVY